MYELTLLPVIREQVISFGQHNEDMREKIEKEYTAFLAFLDGQSATYEGRPQYADLQAVYQFAADRRDQLIELLGEEKEDLEILGKMLDDIEKKGDEREFSDLAAQLIEQGDYKMDIKAFESWIKKEAAELTAEITDVLDDWKAGVEEGKLTDLARLLEAIAQEGDEQGNDDDMFSYMFEGEDDADDVDDEDEVEACNSGSARKTEMGGCCSTKDFEQEGCCGRQVPCCKDEK